MRLINANLTRDEVSRYITTWKCKDCLKDGGEQLVMAVDDIAYLPIIDAKPIVHAHWIEKTEWYHGIGRIHCTCSNCGYTVDYKPGSRGDGRGGKFCDDCGAKMDGGAENKTD